MFQLIKLDVTPISLVEGCPSQEWIFTTGTTGTGSGWNHEALRAVQRLISCSEIYHVYRLKLWELQDQEISHHDQSIGEIFPFISSTLSLSIYNWYQNYGEVSFHCWILLGWFYSPSFVVSSVQDRGSTLLPISSFRNLDSHGSRSLSPSNWSLIISYWIIWNHILYLSSRYIPSKTLSLYRFPTLSFCDPGLIAHTPQSCDRGPQK